MNPTTLRALARELYALADGKEPAARSMGICRQIYSTLGFAAHLLFFIEVLGGDGNPLGDYRQPGDHWSGKRGAARRTLAGFCAAYIETELLGESV